MPRQTPLPPVSSSEFAPALYLEPRPSRILELWWCALHALLVAASLLVGWPWPLRIGCACAALVHAAVRRPRPPPKLLVVGADGSWRIPEWSNETVPLARPSTLTPLGLDLHLGMGPRRRHLLLLRDQIDADDWRRLNAILRRAHARA